MFKMRVALLSLLALLVLSGVAASAASATGPYWRVAGAKLETTVRQIKLQNKGLVKFRVPSKGLEVRCRRVISEGATIIGNLNNQGQDKGRLTMTSCENPAGCTVAEPIVTVPLLSSLATAATQKKYVDYYTAPQGTWTTIVLSGGCSLAGNWAVTGFATAEILPATTPVQEGLFVFPEEAIHKIDFEGTPSLTELQMKGNAAIFEGVFSAKLEPTEKYEVF